MKSIAVAAIVCITAIMSVVVFTNKMVEWKTAQNNFIVVTGSATKSFVSDLIVWRGYFSKKAPTTKEAYENLKADTEAVKRFLTGRGVKDEEIILASIQISENYEYEYSKEGKVTKRTFAGYTLSQRVEITSGEVDKIEKISRDITGLIDSGIDFFSNEPEYYYTKLDELKLDLIAKSAENSRLRAETIARESGAKITKLRSASMGVFQITKENSATDYSYGGTYDVYSKNKTAFITSRLEYLLE